MADKEKSEKAEAKAAPAPAPAPATEEAPAPDDLFAMPPSSEAVAYPPDRLAEMEMIAAAQQRAQAALFDAADTE